MIRVEAGMATARFCELIGRPERTWRRHQSRARADRATKGPWPRPAGGARFSVTARMDKAVTRTITQIPEDGWVGIKYAHAIYDQDEQRWVSDAQVAEITFTAFTSRRKNEHITARLIVRRVKRLNPKSAPTGQGELFSVWRHHAVFTDSHESMLDAEATTATIRAQLITVPGRIARSARTLRIHLPRRWPWEHPWHAMFTAACGPARPAT